MKRIRAIISRSLLGDFHQCVRRLGIFGFDLSEECTGRRDRDADNSTLAKSKLAVDFAVPDEEAKPTVHALLQSVHPDSVGIFKFEQATPPAVQARSD